jgi:transcription initiation factor TFIIIB Brf1 subunit/transcription initiation factor TFIIB|tara:strand:+ start:1214 stop:2170 length:957 start_codon:yes stop_codon:yes gene_type:complete
VLLAAPFAAMSGEAASLCPSCGAHEVRHEFDLGCEICGACGHLVSDRALTTVVSYDDDGARGVFLHDGSASGQHLAAARHGLAGAPGATPGVTRAMFRDQDSAHLANISRAVDFAAQQLRLSKDAANDARALVVKASEGRWGDGDWTTLLVGACVYVSARQNALPIAMRDVAEACQIDLFALGRVYNKLKRLHGVRVPPLDPNAFVARAAAAVPELTAVSISGQKGGKGGGLVGGGDDTEARKEASNRSNGKSVANKGDEEKKNVTEKSTTASRAKDLAPLIHDAKILLKFAHSRGLVTGRNPVPFVAACLGVAAQSR